MHLRPHQPSDENRLASFIGVTHACDWTVRLKAVIALLKPYKVTKQDRSSNASKIASNLPDCEPEHANI